MVNIKRVVKLWAPGISWNKDRTVSSGVLYHREAAAEALPKRKFILDWFQLEGIKSFFSYDKIKM